MVTMDGPVWMPCSGYVRKDAAQCLQEMENRKKDPKLRGVHVEVREKQDAPWPRPFDKENGQRCGFGGNHLAEDCQCDPYGES
jgi:hypothetical protein